MENIIFKKISKNAKQTINIGYEFSKDLHPGDTVLLRGELGAGKTAFVKGAAAQKNARQIASSPTFTIINEYSGDIDIYHMDLYRIKNLPELFETGFEEYLYCRGIVFIEWPDVAMPILKNMRHKVIEINKIDNETREIIYKTFNPDGE